MLAAARGCFSAPTGLDSKRGRWPVTWCLWGSPVTAGRRRSEGGGPSEELESCEAPGGGPGLELMVGVVVTGLSVVTGVSVGAGC